MKNANNDLAQFTGSETRFRHWLGGIYTEGVNYLAEKWECFWLIDAVFSHQCNKKVKYEQFQVWKLSRIKDSKFLLTCEDGNKNLITKQNIPFSDFKDDEVTVWLIDGILILPSEY